MAFRSQNSILLSRPTIFPRQAKFIQLNICMDSRVIAAQKILGKYNRLSDFFSVNNAGKHQERKSPVYTKLLRDRITRDNCLDCLGNSTRT